MPLAVVRRGPAGSPATPARGTVACFLAIALIGVAAALPDPARAQATPSPPNLAVGTDASVFVDRWRQALAQPGGEGIAEITAWPFLFEGRRLSREGFLARVVPALFHPAARRCLQRTRPVAEGGRLVITCAAHGYVFAPTAGGWRFTEFFAETP